MGKSVEVFSLDWVVGAIAIVLVLSIGVKLLQNLASLAAKILRWLFKPKEFWSGFLVHGSFRPRTVTILLVTLEVIILCAVTFLLFVMGLESDWLGYASVGMLIVLPITTKKFWNFLRDREQSAVQHRRDGQAELLRQSVTLGNEDRTFCLYLRPFRSTGSISVSVLDSTGYMKTPRGKPLPPTHDQRFHDLETLLAMALDGYTPLVALGRPGEQVGAGRILTTDENWRQVFSHLANKATLILLLPSPQPGTTWELRIVLNDFILLSKTLFIIPPQIGASVVQKDALNSFSRVAVGRQWDEALLLGGESVERSGAVFRWDHGSRCITHCAPLLTYVGPSPVRFLFDLWLSRETEVLSGWRLKRNLLNVLNYTPEVKRIGASEPLFRASSMGKRA